MTETVAALTVTVQVAFLPPSFVVTVMVAEPAAFAVTTPELETEATVELLEDQVTLLFVAFEGVTVATRDWVSPSFIVRDVMFRLTPVTETVAALTVTEQVAVLPPSFVVTEIVAVPAFFAVTTPLEETVATVVLFEDHVTFLFDAFEGATVATSVSVSPSVKVNVVLSRVTPVTATSGALTVTVQVAFLPPSFVVTVIVAEPAFFAVMTPVEDTVATVVLFDDQVTDLSVASDGETVATRVWVSPTSIVREVLFRLTPVTGITMSSLGSMFNRAASAKIFMVLRMMGRLAFKEALCFTSASES